MKRPAAIIGLCAAAIAVAAFISCGGCKSEGTESGKGGQRPATAISIDGSSTVGPISKAVAEEFMKVNPNMPVTVGISGTGGGMKKFIVGKIDIEDASRPIKPEEVATAKTNGIDFIELPVAYDGVSVVVNPANKFVDKLTVAELKKIWDVGSTVKKWSDVRPGWPQEDIRLYGPTPNNGTFEYFTEAINGKAKQSRADYTAGVDPPQLVQGVAGDKNGLAYFGFVYYNENKDKLRVIPVDGGSGPVVPSPETIRSNTYHPLSRPIFIYVSAKALDRPEVQKFVEYYINNAPKLTLSAGYVPLPDAIYAKVLQRFKDRKTGTGFKEGIKVGGVKLEDLYGK